MRDADWSWGELIGDLTWYVPLLFAALSWLAVKLRETQWGHEFAQRIGIERREHELEWEFQRRVGSYWLSLAVIVGVITYSVGQRLLEPEPEPPVWVPVVVILGVIIAVWSITKFLRSFRSARRDP